jgi:hypothetical protein
MPGRYHNGFKGRRGNHIINDIKIMGFNDVNNTTTKNGYA